MTFKAEKQRTFQDVDTNDLTVYNIEAVNDGDKT